MDTQNDTDQHVPEADYTAYVDHLKNCAECGRTRCLAGETLCNAYLARVRLMMRTAPP
ncbi:hypothetical protein [Streptomyces sp. CL12-4]|uniref:hypothetical protein n=1 Tax=Streptomyces sp. CL12-4 TaxID=2810306 RepID=UPI001EFC12FF|nr:hypothetical protein [Streptomyces sp. CL12-4]MCG8971564.1 hypothetical protein [Streptomyces sp. CL12-4]